MLYPSALSLSSCANSAGTELLAVACSQLTGDRWNGEVVLCDAVTLRPRGTLRTASGATDVQWLSGSGDRLLSAFDDGGVYLSRLSLCALPPLVASTEVPDVLSSIEASYLDHDDCVTAIAQSAQSTHFVSASFDCTVRYWDIAQPAQPVRVIHSHTSPVLAVAPLLSADASSNADQHCFASGDLCGDVLIWDARSSSAVPLASVRAVPAVAAQGGAPEVGELSVTALTAHQNLLFVGSQDGTLAAFDLRNTSNALFRHAVHADAVRSIAVQSNEQRISVATASDDHFAQVHQIDGSQLTQTWKSEDLGDCARAVLFRSESSVVVAAWKDVLKQYSF